MHYHQIQTSYLTCYLQSLNHYNDLTDINEGIGCIYESAKIVYMSTTDIVNSTYTSKFNGYVQCIARSQKESGTPFIRLVINNTMIFEGIVPSGMYTYLWSPLFLVKKNDIIQYTITTESSDGSKELRIYNHK